MSAAHGAHPVILFTGRFGSGKTEVALNYARSLVQGGAPAAGAVKVSDDAAPVILIDLDIVTPYFRSREMAERFAEYGLEIVAPSVIGQHLDTPALTPQILGAIERPDRRIVLDVGGDKQGARALGQYSGAIGRRGYVMHFVVNPYRPFTSTLNDLADSISEIEESSRLTVTDLVSNPNLITETKAEHILQGHALIESFAQELGLPIAFVCLERSWADRVGHSPFSQPMLVLDRSFVQPWE
jgi:DNA polymerase III delta prime subunit